MLYHVDHSCFILTPSPYLLQLELSNDELYSSSPREFAVYLTDRYPTREWNKVGQFTAESRRGPQSFHLPTVVFGKFVKVSCHPPSALRSPPLGRGCSVVVWWMGGAEAGDGHWSGPAQLGGCRCGVDFASGCCEQPGSESCLAGTENDSRRTQYAYAQS